MTSSITIKCGNTHAHTVRNFFSIPKMLSDIYQRMLRPAIGNVGFWIVPTPILDLHAKIIGIDIWPRSTLTPVVKRSISRLIPIMSSRSPNDPSCSMLLGDHSADPKTICTDFRGWDTSLRSVQRPLFGFPRRWGKLVSALEERLVLIFATISLKPCLVNRQIS